MTATSLMGRTKKVLPADKRFLIYKNGVWLYFFLLLLEGALRKWVFPSLATPLLVIRDPLVCWLLFRAWKENLFPSNSFVRAILLVGGASFLTALTVGHGNIAVALFGARIFFFHFPFMFLIGKVFDRSDVLKMGKVIICFSIPMTILIVMQFYSPQSAWVNLGIGGNTEGTASASGLQGGLGFLRPPGTFSFATGTTSFYGLVASYILLFWLMPSGINKLLLISATFCLIAAIPLSISRSLLFQVAFSLLFFCIAISKAPKFARHIFITTLSFAFLLLIVTSIPLFQTAVAAFSDRFNSANNLEGGLAGTLGDRYLGGMLSAITNSFNLPFFGVGLGMGTNAGSMLLTGQQTFLIAEGEWGRLIGEMGLLFGLAIIIVRLILSVKLTIASYAKLKTGDAAPWMLLSSALLLVLQGGWAQPTSLGFCTFTGGLVFASFRVPKK